MYRFAIIGCGRISKRHAENIIKVGQLKAVCDSIPERADALAAEYDCTAYYSVDDLLVNEKEVDVVSVCSPNGFHAEHSIKSLQAGKHVLCEKPMCITTAAAWQIIETEKFSRKKLMVVKSARFNPLLQQLKALIDNGSLGTVYSFQLSCFWHRPTEYYNDWHGKLFPDGGTLYTQFSHYIDALIWLLGEPEQVQGFTNNAAHGEAMEFEDTGVASLKLKNGALGTLNWSVNAYRQNSEIALTIIAENGTISLGGEYLNKIRYQQLASKSLLVTGDNEANDYTSYKGSMSHHGAVYENLVRHLSGKSQDFTGPIDGMQTVHFIEKIYNSVSK